MLFHSPLTLHFFCLDLHPEYSCRVVPAQNHIFFSCSFAHTGRVSCECVPCFIYILVLHLNACLHMVSIYCSKSRKNIIESTLFTQFVSFTSIYRNTVRHKNSLAKDILFFHNKSLIPMYTFISHLLLMKKQYAHILASITDTKSSLVSLMYLLMVLALINLAMAITATTANHSYCPLLMLLVAVFF